MGLALLMFTEPPLPQLEERSVVTVRRVSSTIVRVACAVLWILRKKSRTAGSRQRSGVVVRVLRLRSRLLAEVVTSVTVLMVAMAFCAAPLRVMLEGRSEHVAYWPGLMGVQLRITVPLKTLWGVRVRE